MNDDQIDDLKQFIAATVLQAIANLATKDELKRLEHKIEHRIDALDKKMDDGFVGVAEAIEEIHREFEKTNTSVERRLTNLEQQAA